MVNEASNIAHHLVAASMQNELKSYLDRGRRFERESLAGIREIFIHEMNDWANSPPPWRERLDLADVTADFGLRNIEPPGEEVMDAYEKLNGLVDQRISEMKEGDGTGYIDQRIQEYLRAKQSQN